MKRCHKQLYTGLGVVTRSMLVKGARDGSVVYSRIKARKDVFARCYKKTAVHVCTLMILLVTVNIDAMIVCVPFGISNPISPILHVQDLIMILTDVYFRRFKINHDMHEFILDSSTVANIYDHL